MSDDLQISEYGKASVESGQGYAPMPPAQRELEEAQQEKSAFDRGVERLSAIDQAGESQPLPVHYHEAGDPNKTSDPKLTLEPERAAKDLADWRRGQEEIQQTLKDIELSEEIDRLRGAEAAQPQQPQPQAPAEPVALDQQQVQPEVPPAPPGYENDELVKAFQREPKLLEAVQTLSWQHDQKVAAAAQQALQYEQALNQQYAQVAQQNASMALSSMFASFPELRGMSVEQINNAFPILERSNPDRANQIRAHVAQVGRLRVRVQHERAHEVESRPNDAAGGGPLFYAAANCTKHKAGPSAAREGSNARAARNDSDGG